MKLLILHLSDIHISSEGDDILKRPAAIIDSTQNIAYPIDAILLLLTGDIAFSGKTEQYDLALTFIQQLRSFAQDRIKPRIHSTPNLPFVICAVPGNHDCTFQGKPEFRQHLISGANKDTLLDQQEFLLACLTVQDNFFSFLEGLDDHPYIRAYSDVRDRMYYRKEFNLAAHRINIMCINTAWLSQIHEQQGTLKFPPDLIPASPHPHDLRIMLFHHPYPWLQPDNRRLVRRKIEHISDLVLTGHEHDPDMRINISKDGEVNQYIEAGLLHDSHNKTSQFSAIILDLETRKQRITIFEWNNGKYEPAIHYPSDTSANPWEDYQVARLATRGDFPFSPSFTEFLSDIGLPLTHPSGDVLKLQDIFVYPDIRYTTLNTNKSYLLKGKAILDEIQQNRYILITGDDQSGKTSLAKQIAYECHRRGFVPIYIDCDGQKFLRDERIYATFEEAVSHQYSSQVLANYRNLNKDKRVLILDNFHKSRNTNTHKAEILKLLLQYATRVIVFGDMVQSTMEQLTTPQGLDPADAPTKSYRLMPFGQLLRNELIEKWLSLSKTEDEINLAHLIRHSLHTINTVIGKNFIPAYPIYVLSILQNLHAGMPLDLKAGTFGYYYELLLKYALARGSNQSQYNSHVSYLSFLAYSMHQREVRTLTSAETRQLHDDYNKRYDTNHAFEGTLQALERRRFIKHDASGYRFSHRFAFYYFVACYFRDQSHLPQIKAEIVEMSKHMHDEEYANIFLFIVYLIKDPFVIDAVVDIAQKQYRECTGARFEKDVDFLQTMGLVESDLKLDGPLSPAENRRKSLDSADKLAGIDDPSEDVHEPPIEKESPNEDELVERLRVALRVQQIVGQILKNYSQGGLEGMPKLSLARECYGISLRAMGFWLNWIDNYKGEIIEGIKADLLCDTGGKPVMAEVEAQTCGKGIIAGLTTLMGIGMVKRLSRDLGAPGLELTYKRVYDELQCNAVDLVDLSIALDHTGELPESRIVNLAGKYRKERNHFAFTVLQNVVAHHLMYFPVDVMKRQRMYAKLNITTDVEVKRLRHVLAE